MNITPAIFILNLKITKALRSLSAMFLALDIK